MVDDKPKAPAADKGAAAAAENGGSVRLRDNGTAAGERRREGVDEATNSAMNALQRGMGALQDTDMENNDVEEIKRLDNQLSHLNEHLSKTAAKLSDRHERLAETLEQKRSEQQNKRASFHQRLAASREEDDAFAAQMAAMLGKCEQMRKVSAQPGATMTTLPEQQQQANGH